MTNPPGAMPPLPEPSGLVHKGYKRTHLIALEDLDNKELVFSAAKLHAYAAPLIARVAELQAELERTERNRDMWKGQCERQAEKLTDFHANVPALEKDAARYRWILEQDFKDDPRNQNFSEFEASRARRIDAAIAAKD